MGKYVDFYCKDNNRELKKIVDPIIMKNFGWLAQKDYDDFYSMAANVVWDCEQKFDDQKVKSNNFKSFLSSCIHNKVKTQLTYMHRDKRVYKDCDGNPIYDTSIDMKIDDDDQLCIGDLLQSDFDMDAILLENMGSVYSEDVEEYLNSLSELPRKIAKLIMNGYSIGEIKKDLNLTDRQYQNCWNVIKSYDKKRIFYKDNNEENDEEMNAGILVEDVAETYKNTSYSIESISKQLQKKRIRDDHILQRHSGQWKGFAKSELISDVLRGKSLTQIIISEEIKNGLRMQWLIDGKQRCTTLDDYLHDGFVISKNVKNYNIRYQTTKVDEDGNEVLNEDGFTEMEFKEFDIRGKKFSQLPEELQDVFKDRQIPVLYNMNCSKKDIADDIARFNRSSPMNKAQNGWLGLDESFAEFVENIAKMQFFQADFTGSSYTNNNHTAGTIRRIIVESIMVSDFIDEFTKDFEKICEFLSEEASDSNFTEFYSLIERLTSVSNEKAAKMFNAKDSFLWFGLFSKFSNTGLEDKKFIEFLNKFEDSLHSKKIDGVSYDDLNGKSTKDKNVVISKMTHLAKLMKEFLQIDEEDLEEMDIKEFIEDNVNPVVTEEDIADYKEDFEILTLNVDNGSKLLDEENRPSLLSIIAYGYKEDKPIDEWFVDYFSHNNTYLRNQKENYAHMKASLDLYYESSALTC